MTATMPTKRQTIIHNVGDEPITVQQTDGSELTVPPGASLPADLLSEADAVDKGMIGCPSCRPQAV